MLAISRSLLLPLVLGLATTSAIAQTQSDEWRRNVTNIVVALSSVEMFSLRLDQANRACSSQSESARATVARLRSRLKEVAERLKTLQVLVRSRAKVYLGAESEAEHFQKTSVGNQRLVEQVRTTTAFTPEVSSDRCASALATYREQLNEMEELALSLESQPNLRDK